MGAKHPKDPKKGAAMLDRLSPSAEEMPKEAITQAAEQWIGGFGAALQGGSETALSGLFASDSHWRNLFGVSWHFATFSGNRTLARELLQRAAEVGASGFRLDTTALAPRKATVAGRDVIEAIFSFYTVHGPGVGALRLLPASNGLAAAWTISTSLDFDQICAARENRS